MIRCATTGVVRRAVTDLASYPRQGEKIHGFTLLRTKQVPELKLVALHLQHDKTGADYLHIARNDRNNVFSIGFKTNPPNDTGVPHILEHTTLCGSEKYPIRDPFFKMLPRTLSNFMNAFTSSDHTSYPFATTNEQDFQNLMSVYLDATLHPLLKQSDFHQEGWRIGPQNPKAPDGHSSASEEDDKLVFKGVVYNEMKGQMSDAGYLFYIRFQDHIFPDIHNSGGDPQKMTDLTYDQLKDFHMKNYHPSNAKVFTYGDMPLSNHLKEVNAHLNSFDRIQGGVEIKEPIDLSDGPRNVTISGPVDPLVAPDMQHKTSTSWLMGKTADVLENFSLGLISALLMDGYGSPLYRNLIEAGLGTDWSSNSGYDGSGKIGIFSVGLTGVKKENLVKVKQTIQKTLHEAHQNGFDKTKIDGYLQQMEIGLKHKTAQFGMSLMQRIEPGWFQGVDPFDTLAWNDTISAFEAKHAEGGYLESLLENYLLNDKTLTFTMIPSATFSDRLAQEEADRLAHKIADVTKVVGGEVEAHNHLLKQELGLLGEQSKSNTQDVSCLPTVHVTDIPRRKEAIEISDSKFDAVDVQWRQAPTNGLTYFRAVAEFDELPVELRPYIPLFTDSIMRLGTQDTTMEQLEDLMKLYTGGITAGYSSSTSPLDFNLSTEGIVITGTALDRNVPRMFDLLRKLLTETDFDSVVAESRVRELLQASANGAVNNVASSGHSYAISAAQANLSDYFWRREQINGLSQLKLVTSLASRPESQGLGDVMCKLKTIQQIILSNHVKLRTALTCGQESVVKNETALKMFLSSLPANMMQCPSTPSPYTARNSKMFFPLPYQVYYGALVVPTVPYTHPAGAPLQILSQLMTHKYLHHEVREKGGAYGGGAFARGLDGVFGFYSYRDPNPQNTMSIMRRAGRWAVDKQWTDRDLEEAKLSVFQSVDAPESVSDEGMTRFVSAVSDDMIQERRERLLDVTPKQIRDVAQRYIAEPLSKDQQSLAFIGEKRPWIDSSWVISDIGLDLGDGNTIQDEGDVKIAAPGS